MQQLVQQKKAQMPGNFGRLPSEITILNLEMESPAPLSPTTESRHPASDAPGGDERSRSPDQRRSKNPADHDENPLLDAEEHHNDDDEDHDHDHNHNHDHDDHDDNHSPVSAQDGSS